MKRLAAAAVAVLVLAGVAVAGYAVGRGGVDATQSTQYQGLQAKNQGLQTKYSDNRSQLSIIEGQLAGAQSRASQAETKYTELAGRVAAIKHRAQLQMDTAATTEQLLAARKKSLDQQSAGLDRRAARLNQQQTVAAQSRFGGDGTFVTGQDMLSGTYRSSGARGCYYAFKDGLGSNAGIIDNNLTDGPAIVTLNDGDIFETSGCAEWVKE